MLLTVTSPVPRWATSNRKAPYVTRPDDQDFQEFMTAVARHYGSEVSIYSIWNEPNHPAFLLPQCNSNGTPASGRIYRGLYQAGYAGLQAAGIAHPRVLFGETAPTGYDTVRPLRSEGAKALLHDVAPLAFMREALCLNAKYRKAGSCSELQMSGYAHHAYTLRRRAPTTRPPERDDVTIGVLSRLSQRPQPGRARARDPGERADLPDRVRGAELSRTSISACRVAQQAEYDAIAEHIAYDEPPRGGVLAVPAQRRPARRGARSERARRHGRLPDRAWSTSTARPSRSTTAGRSR